MRVAILSYGSRGDVQPFVAIAHALRARGVDVVLGAPEDHVAFAKVSGAEVKTISGDSAALLKTPEGRAWVKHGDVRAFMRAFLSTFERLKDDVERQCEDITTGTDIILTGALISASARYFANLHNIPYVACHTFPFLPSRHVDNGMADLPSALTKLPLMRPLISRASSAVLWRLFGHFDNEARDRRHMPRAPREPLIDQFERGHPSLHLWSPSLIPRPPDWPNEIVTGMCVLPPEVRTSLGERSALDAIEPFLAQGPPPVFIGLGSMPIEEPAPFLDMVTRVVTRLNLRALIGGTFDRSAIASLPPSMMLCPPIDHDVLLPRCAGVVHHGGAGTTHTALRAGQPTFIVSVLGDQPFWGRLIHDKGVGSWTRFRTLTEQRLTDGLSLLLRPDTRARAFALGERIKSEADGAACAADAIVKLASAASPLQ